MAVNSRFRTLAFALRNHVTDTYQLLAAVDAVMDLDGDIDIPRPTITTPDGKATWNWTYNRWDHNHTDLVDLVLANDSILRHLFDSKKINAIKELRAVALCGLKEAKDAVEDERVTDYVERERNDPWSRWSHDEPPF